jgi:CheY-like chemotaxis protein
MSKRVLLVDDEEDIRETLRDLLEDQGFAVEVACNGREALELLRDRDHAPFCFVLLDLMMPVMDGWELLDAIAADSALAGLTIYISTSIPDRAPLGRPVLPKPLDVRRLLAEVRLACR